VVNGLALGGGLELALTADVIVALENAVFAFPETGIGIYPGLGGTRRTANRIGKGLTKFMIYTGQMLKAQQAKEIGLVDHIISWTEYQTLTDHWDDLSRRSSSIPEEWHEIENFFQKNPVNSLLNQRSEIPEKLQKPVARVRLKAPIALQLSERLIDDQKGPESELAFIEDIFKTTDALAGLKSVGKKPPVFKGY